MADLLTTSCIASFTVVTDTGALTRLSMAPIRMMQWLGDIRVAQRPPSHSSARLSGVWGS